jgi:divinyl chlorophyllide a 8-vinyl-reductase
MLVWDEARERYDAQATPSFGSTTLRDHYARLLEGGVDGEQLGDHRVFGD